MLTQLENLFRRRMKTTKELLMILIILFVFILEVFRIFSKSNLEMYHQQEFYLKNLFLRSTLGNLT